MVELRLTLTFDRLRIVALAMGELLKNEPATELEHMQHSILRSMYGKAMTKLVAGREAYRLQYQPHETLTLRRVLMFGQDFHRGGWERNEMQMLTNIVDRTLPVSAKR